MEFPFGCHSATFFCVTLSVTVVFPLRPFPRCRREWRPTGSTVRLLDMSNSNLTFFFDAFLCEPSTSDRPAVSAPSADFSYGFSYTFESWYDDDDADPYGEPRTMSVRQQSIGELALGFLQCPAGRSSKSIQFKTPSRPSDLLIGCRLGVCSFRAI